MKKEKDLDFITTEKYTKEDIKRCQKRLLEMIVQVHEIFEKHHIRYIICFGTLLGAVRHGGFIPWDDDLDINVFDHDYDKAIEVLRKELPKDIFIQDSSSEDDYDCNWAKLRDMNSETLAVEWPQDNRWSHRGICLDIYRMFSQRVEVKRGLMYRKYLLKTEKNLFVKCRRLLGIVKCAILKIYLKISGSGKICYFDRVVTEKELFPLKKYKFEQYEFWGPNDSHSFLKNLYGSYLEIPKLEDRRPHYGWIKFKE